MELNGSGLGCWAEHDVMAGAAAWERNPNRVKEQGMGRDLIITYIIKPN